MTEPNLFEYTLVVEAPNRAYIRHNYKHSPLCAHRINVATISGEPLAIPIADLVRKCAEHDAECPWLRVDRRELGPFLQPDYIAAPVSGPGAITPMRRGGGATS